MPGGADRQASFPVGAYRDFGEYRRSTLSASTSR